MIIVHWASKKFSKKKNFLVVWLNADFLFGSEEKSFFWQFLQQSFDETGMDGCICSVCDIKTVLLWWKSLYHLSHWWQTASEIHCFFWLVSFTCRLWLMIIITHSEQNLQLYDKSDRHPVIHSVSSNAWQPVSDFFGRILTPDPIRKALMHFKPGAFIPGAPVQPVLIKYHVPEHMVQSYVLWWHIMSRF